jgi:hypothetical protein
MQTEQINQYGRNKGDKRQMKISEAEWKQYLEEKHSNYQFCKPKKEDIEKFLTWREGVKNDKKKRSR